MAVISPPPRSSAQFSSSISSCIRSTVTNQGSKLCVSIGIKSRIRNLGTDLSLSIVDRRLREDGRGAGRWPWMRRSGEISGGRGGGAVCCSAEGIGMRGIARGDGVPAAIPIRLPERAKVVAMVAFVMSLCNADRVVMSVAVVPLAASHGWSSSFVGIVQGYFVLLSWMPVYFKTVYNVNLKQAVWFSAIPWGMMAVTGYVAGASSDSLIKSGYSVTRVRKIMQSIGFIGPGVSLLCLNYARSPTAAAILMTVALSLSSFSQAGFLLNMQDIAPQYAGFLHGITNSVGTLAAVISTIGTGYFVQWLGSFQAILTLTSVL